jgi:hypothetical protein
LGPAIWGKIAFRVADGASRSGDAKWSRAAGFLARRPGYGLNIAWRENHGAYARVHGAAAYAAQELFHAVIARLYDRGSLSGVRLVARVA